MRCQNKSALILVLFLTSLFFFSSCGIPRIITLDDDILLSKEDGILGDSVVAEITVADGSIGKLSELFSSSDEGPSLKLFYVLSSLTSGPVTNLEEHSASYNLNTVPSNFSSAYIPTSNNGIPWSPPNNTEGPALYIYTDSHESPGKVSRTRPEQGGMIDQPEGILVGTFAQSPTKTDGPGGYYFGTSPDMDLLIEPAHYDKTLRVTLEREPFTPTDEAYPVKHTNSFLIKTTIEVVEDSSSETVYFADYRRFPFPFPDSENWSSDDFASQYIDVEDAYFYHNLREDYTTSKTLYVHVYGAIYAGVGNFTNIYWSPMEYLGYIQL